MRPRPSRAFHPIENDSAGLEEEGEFCSLGSDRATSSHSSWHSRTMINSPWVWLLTGRSTALENRRPSNSSGSSGSIGKFLNSSSGGGGSTSSSHSAGSRLVITNGLRLAVVLILCSCFVPLYLLLQAPKQQHTFFAESLRGGAWATAYGGEGETVLVVGDWGAPPDQPQFQATQRLVMRGMEVLVREAKHRVTHVVNLGDAFYMNGITDEHDPRYDATWKAVSEVAPSLAKLPWESVLGNHDCRGNVSALLAKGASRGLGRHHPGFRLPGRYYARKLMDLHWVFLDTCSLVCGVSSGGSDSTGRQQPYEDPFLLAQADAVLAAGPKSSTASQEAFTAAVARVVAHHDGDGNVDRRKAAFAGVLNRRSECQSLPEENKPDPSDQLAWLDAILAQQRQHDQRLAKSGHGGAEPLIVVGHAPVFSAGLPPHGHGEYPQLMAQLHERFKSTNNKPTSSVSSLKAPSSTNNNSTSRESASSTSSVRGIGSVLGGGGGLGGLGGGLSGLGGGHRANKLATPASAIPTNTLGGAGAAATTDGTRSEAPGGMRGSTVGTERAAAAAASSDTSSSPVAFYLSGDEHSIQDVHRDGVHYVIAGTGGGLDLHDLIPQTDADGNKIAGYPGLEFSEQSLGFAALTRIRTTGDLRLKLYRVRPGTSAASDSTAEAPSFQERRKLSDALPLPNGNFLARFWWWLKMPRAPPPLPTAEVAGSSTSGDEPEPIIEVIHSVTISSRRREWAAGGSR